MTPQALVAHPGTQYSHHLARELHRTGMLSGFHTGLALSEDSFLVSLVEAAATRAGFERQFQNRLVRGVPAAKLHRYPALEIGAWYRSRSGGPAKDALRARNDAFQRAIPDRALAAADVVIGFDTSSALLADRLRMQSAPLVLDRSIGHPRSHARVADELRRRYPEWHVPAATKTEHDLAIEDQEHAAARLIVVPSGFAARTLVENGIPRDKIRVNPFGTDETLFCPQDQAPDLSKLIFLFVGAISARKGVPLLLDAWKRLGLNDAELWIAGTGDLPTAERASVGQNVRWLGAVTRRDLPALMRRAHVFVFPSFFEGLAQVQVEAAATALPIIATPASGAEEIIEEGKTGFLVDAGNTAQLIERMECLAAHRDRIAEMRTETRRRASEWSWRAYGDRWQRILIEDLPAA
jgi:glycosyltransferase involved in cell wall biosynthesis